MIGYSDQKINHVMARIQEVRYTDLDEEQRLCHELFTWAQSEDNAYCQAFALAYLGDYYVALYDEENATKHLLEAKKLLGDEECWDVLRMRVFSLLGICYEIRADEPSAVEAYLQALAMAEKLEDVDGECVVLNNLAFLFQRHRCYKEAMNYFQRAYQLQAFLKDVSNRSSILSNFAEIMLALHRYEEARGYIEEAEREEPNPELRKILGYRSWCGYFAAVGEKNKAVEYAALLLANQTTVNQDKLSAFTTYQSLCQIMMELGEGEYAGRFLKAMEDICGKGLDQMRALEDTMIHYTISYLPSQAHEAAYLRFYENNKKLCKKNNEMIASAMKSKIFLDQLMEQTEQMQTEQESLQQEVNRDRLTGAYSRNFLETLMRDMVDGTTNSTMSLVILDVDCFKEYNDHYGHLKGDVVLREVASCLLMGSQKDIYPCRYGGDEFVCICDGLSAEDVEAYIHSVWERLHTRALPHETSLCSDEVSLSAGYVVREAGTSVEAYALLQLADQALYESKRSGRNTYTRKRADTS